MSDDWLTKKLPFSFFENAGRYTPEQIIERFREIPEDNRLLAYTIIQVVREASNANITSCFLVRQLIFSIYDDLLRRDSIDIKLPHYWFMDGVMIEPEWIVRITNGIVGWECDDSCRKCGRTEECRFYKGEH